jgi:hypothetical protein
MATNAASVYCSQHLSVLSEKLEGYKADKDAQKEDRDREHAHFVGILSDACTIVRQVVAAGTPPDILEDVKVQVDSVIHDALNFGYGQRKVKFMPSFAHSPQFPKVKDKTELHLRALCEWRCESLLTDRLTSILEARENYGGIVRLFCPCPCTCARNAAAFPEFSVLIELDSS